MHRPHRAGRAILTRPWADGDGRSGALLAAADLDGTLVFSERGLGTGPGAGHHPVEALDGRPSAWVLVEAVPDLTALAVSGRLVPVTTRSLEQYRRITLPGPPPPWAVVANGGQLLRDGVVDAAWDARVHESIAAGSAPVGEVLARLGPLAAQSWVRVVRDVGGLFTYLVATDRAAIPAGVLDELAVWAAPRGLDVSQQGRKVYVVPGSLTKEAAVAEVVRRAGGAGFVAAGDSRLDAGLLAAAAAAIRPAHGELHLTGWHRPHVRVTASTGTAAGAEIAAWLRAAVLGPSPVRPADRSTSPD